MSGPFTLAEGPARPRTNAAPYGRFFPASRWLTIPGGIGEDTAGPNRYEVNEMTLKAMTQLDAEARSHATRGDVQEATRQDIEPGTGEATDGAAHPGPEQAQPARNAPAHPRLFRGLFPTPGQVYAPSRTPTSIAFPAAKPEPALNSNCSLVTSSRGRFHPVTAWKRPARKPCHHTQSLVHPQYGRKRAGCQRTRRGCQGW